MDPKRSLSNIEYFTGFLTGCLLAGGMVEYACIYKDGCLDHAENFMLIWRNLIVAGGIYFILNLLPKSWDKIQNLNLMNWILCRYMMIYLLIPGAINKIMKIHYRFSYTTANERIFNLKPSNLLWQVYSTSDTYEMLIGIGQMIIIVMLTFRRTTSIAALILLPILINNLAIAIVFDSCSILHYAMPLCFTLGIVIFMLPKFVKWISSIKFHKLLGFNQKQREHVMGIITITKIIFIVGFMMQHLWKVDRSRTYYAQHKEHPLIGIWDVDTLKANSENFPEFKRLIFEQSIFGNVEVKDSITGFYYLVDTNYHQMEFYNFHEFRELDLKGKYNFLDSNTVEYIGRNNKDSLYFTLKKQVIKK